VPPYGQQTLQNSRQISTSSGQQPRSRYPANEFNRASQRPQFQGERFDRRRASEPGGDLSRSYDRTPSMHDEGLRISGGMRRDGSHDGRLADHETYRSPIPSSQYYAAWTENSDIPPAQYQPVNYSNQPMQGSSYSPSVSSAPLQSRTGRTPPSLNQVIPSLSALSMSGHPPRAGELARHSTQTTSSTDGGEFRLSIPHEDFASLGVMHAAAIRGGMDVKVAWAKQVLIFVERHQVRSSETRLPFVSEHLLASERV
jgi:hypothetical protein